MTAIRFKPLQEKQQPDVSPSREDYDIDVLVAGAGPTGSTLAADLLRCGLRVRLVDKAPPCL
ncbi:FAD-dependent monooxygenase [Paenibacillus amylolyticus]|nr:FAD-dependent monooxygenase [Paenibacillus amylolyticus]